VGMGNFKNKHKGVPCHPPEPKEELCLERDYQNQIFDYNKGLGFV
jgi:hypothetical protein